MPLPILAGAALTAIVQALTPVLADAAVEAVMGDSPAASQVAGAAVSIVSELAGVPIATEPEAKAAAQAVLADPEKLATAKLRSAEAAATIMRAENERLAIVNETMRAEAANADPFVRRMRPFFGYIMALSWGGLMAAASWTIVTDPSKAGAVLSGIAETTALWGIGLAVLGVYVWKRSEEKGAGGLADLLGKR